MERRQRVAEAAIAVLAQAGARGLTHRAVDHQARLPEGSTSNLYRTRAALIGAIVDELLADDEACLADLRSILQSQGEVGAFLARFIRRTIETRRNHTLARFALLADPDATAMIAGRARLIDFLSHEAGSAGSEVNRSAITLALAFGDGVMADAVIFGTPFDEAAVAQAISRILAPPAR